MKNGLGVASLVAVVLGLVGLGVATLWVDPLSSTVITRTSRGYQAVTYSYGALISGALMALGVVGSIIAGVFKR